MFASPVAPVSVFHPFEGWVLRVSDFGGCVLASVGVMADEALDRLRVADERWHEAKALVVALNAERRDAVRGALAAGHRQGDVASVLGITQASVSQLASDDGVRRAARRRVR